MNQNSNLNQIALHVKTPKVNGLVNNVDTCVYAANAKIELINAQYVNQ